MGDERPLAAAAFSPDGTVLATAAWSGLLKLWALPTCSKLLTIRAHTDRVTGVPPPRLKRSTPLSLRTPMCTWTGPPHDTIVLHTCDPCGRGVSAKSFSGMVRVNCGVVRTSRPRSSLPRHGIRLRLETNRCGAGRQGQRRRRRLNATCSCRRQFWPPLQARCRGAIHTACDLFAGAGIAWHPHARGESAATAPAASAEAGAGDGADAAMPPAEAPSGTVHLATGGADCTLRLWGPGGAALRTLAGHTKRLARVAFHPAGGHVGSASFDGTWRLWDAEAGACLLEQEGHSREVRQHFKQVDRVLLEY